MPSYAIAQLRDVTMNSEIIAYLKAIDDTLKPYGGTFLVHGAPITRLEGDWPSGDLIVIGFPNRSALDAWYCSPSYQRILPLRTRNAAGDVIMVDGVTEPHNATDILSPGLPVCDEMNRETV